MTEIKGRDGELKLLLRPDALLRVENIPELLHQYGSPLTFTAKGTPYFLLRYKKCGVVEKDAEHLISLTEKLLADMERLLGENDRTNILQ